MSFFVHNPVVMAVLLSEVDPTILTPQPRLLPLPLSLPLIAGGLLASRLQLGVQRPVDEPEAEPRDLGGRLAGIQQSEGESFRTRRRTLEKNDNNKQYKIRFGYKAYKSQSILTCIQYLFGVSVLVFFPSPKI